MTTTEPKTQLFKTSTQKTKQKTHQVHFLQRKVFKWKPEEDKQLLELIALYGKKNWKKISEIMKTRNSIQCLHRWSKILQPGLTKGPWNVEEDKKLIDWVAKQGPMKWSMCSEYIPGRSGKQCRERWFNNLDPNVVKGNWTTIEDYKIFKLFQNKGSQWSKIASHFKGRTENSIKNRFYCTLRKIASKYSKTDTSNANLDELLTYFQIALKEKEMEMKKEMNMNINSDVDINEDKEMDYCSNVNNNNNNKYQESVTNIQSDSDTTISTKFININNNSIHNVNNHLYNNNECLNMNIEEKSLENNIFTIINNNNYFDYCNNNNYLSSVMNLYIKSYNNFVNYINQQIFVIQYYNQLLYTLLQNNYPNFFV
jgi:hypothetical protein